MIAVVVGEEDPPYVQGIHDGPGCIQPLGTHCGRPGIHEDRLAPRITIEFIGKWPTGGASRAHGMTNVSSAILYGCRRLNVSMVVIAALLKAESPQRP
ncbi:hypothetical protein STANM309S_06654 [Streptomyces tanashiensis]